MGIHIDQRNNHFYIKFDYDKDLVNAIKRIPGKKYLEQAKTWMVPADQEDKVMAFYKKFSNRRNPREPARLLPIPDLPELRTWIPLVRPLFPFQERGVAAAIAWQRCIIGDQPGLGKTAQAIAAIVAGGPDAFPCLVVCPNSLKHNWVHEWMMVAGRRAVIIDDDTRANWWSYHEKGLADVFITNDEAATLRTNFVASMEVPKGERLMTRHVVLRDQVRTLIKSVIVDESHRHRNVKTKRAKITIKLTEHRQRILALSGTPVVNKTDDLIAQLALIWRLDDFGGLAFFEERYCKTKAYHKELQHLLRRTCFYQRAKSEVLTELPAKTRQKIIVDITNRDEYNAALKDLAGYLKQYKEKTDAQIRKSMQGEVMVRIQACKHIAARGKFQAVQEYVDQFLAVGEKLVIFIFQKVVAMQFMNKYPQALAITGAQSLEDRDANVKAFQTDPARNIIIVSIKMGEGYTLTASSRPMLVEWPWHAAGCDQLEDRTHRISQENHVTVMNFVGFQTVDEQHYQLIEEKRANAEGITGTEDVTNEEVIDRVAASLFAGMSY